MMLTCATAGLQPQNQLQAAQSPGAGKRHSPKPGSVAHGISNVFPLPGPLQAPPAHTFEAGPFGKLNYNFLVSGMGLWQGNPVLSANSASGALNLGKFFLEKTTNWWQFNVQAGAKCN
jgi:hypothetical protein